jgi:transcriptional antiterminator RfaH
MHWYLVHTKPRQEKQTLENLERLGCECFLPMILCEREQHGGLVLSEEPLFPRYLFVRVGPEASGATFAPLLLTKGGGRLLRVESGPVTVADELILVLRAGRSSPDVTPEHRPQAINSPKTHQSTLTRMEDIFLIVDGGRRAMALLEILSRPGRLTTSESRLRQAS